jgi:hypothetical protein
MCDMVRDRVDSVRIWKYGPSNEEQMTDIRSCDKVRDIVRDMVRDRAAYVRYSAAHW